MLPTTLSGNSGCPASPWPIELTFIPIVLGNGKIYLEVDTSVTSLNAANGFAIGGIVVAGRDEQRVRSEIMMEPGQTFAIGGLIQTQTSGQTNKVPVLGDLPFIGTVFSTTTFTDTEP